MSRPEAVQASTASGTSATSLLAPGTAEAVLSAAANMIAQGNQKVLNAATDESALLYKRRELQAHARELYERELQTITAQAATSLAMKRADDLMAVAKNLAAILTRRLMDGEYLSFSSANAAMHVSREPYCPELGKTYLSPLKRTPSLTSTGLFASFDMPSDLICSFYSPSPPPPPPPAAPPPSPPPKTPVGGAAAVPQDTRTCADGTLDGAHSIQVVACFARMCTRQAQLRSQKRV